MRLGNTERASTIATAPPAGRRRAIVVCTHLRPGRTKHRSRHILQPLTGLHIASLIDPRRFDVALYHEDWHGPFDPRQAAGYDLVFLTGLQPDFDRMRQLSYFFRRSGATVVAGGSICSQFPEFAAEFFDVVCIGGLESVPDVVADFETGTLRRFYRSPATRIGEYAINYRLFTESGINLQTHLIEASRGCSFRCSFCVMPVEAGGHAPYGLATLAAAVDSAIAASPRLSPRRWYPTILFLDNNFSDNRQHMLAVCELMRGHRKVRMWGALVTQNILRDRELVRRLAACKCGGLFVGLESLDPAFLRRFRKKQNLGRGDVIADIAYAESQGIVIGYGYLFDPRFQTVAEMQRQVALICETAAMPMPIYLNMVAPLAGTEAFWADLRAGGLAANLRLRDLDGETIAYSGLADTHENLSAFADRMFRRPWEVLTRRAVLRKILHRIVAARSLNPIHWFVLAGANLNWFVRARDYPAQPRRFLAGEDVLDPQYDERPADLADEDRKRYFDPVAVTDAAGGPAAWLVPYMPHAETPRPATANTTTGAARRD